MVVVGAGWIGSEFAASARQRGLDVTLIDPLALPNERDLRRRDRRLLPRRARAATGSSCCSATGVEAFEGDGAVARVRTSGGRTLDCDFAVVGVGVVPARRARPRAPGSRSTTGSSSTSSSQTSAPNVFAAGDVANAWHPFYGERIRVEHWANALNQGPAAARAMLGEEISYDRIPYFFSDQYDVGMEYSGYATEWDEVVFRGDRDGGEFIAFWLRDGRVIAGMNVNVWDVNEHVQALIRSRQTVDVAALSDPDTAA